MRTFIIILISFLVVNMLTTQLNAQESKKIFKKRRQKVELSNYYIAINTNDALFHYTGKLEWKIDSLRSIETNQEIQNNLTFLKYTTTSAIAKTTFHTDPLVGALDTWALTYQLEDYFKNPSSADKYGQHISLLADLFKNYRYEYEQDFNKYIKEESIAELRNFSKNNPIEDDNLNRKSVSPYLSEWLGDEALGFKSGLLTMTDLVRDMSNRMEYYTEMLPKQTKWQMEFEIGEFLSEDSLGIFMDNISKTLLETSQFLGNTESIINYNRDTILSNINYQRVATLHSIRNERVEALKALAMEREIILATMKDERLAIQEFAHLERVAMSKDIQNLSNQMMERSTLVGKELVDYVFLKLIVLCVIIGIIGIISLILFKKL